MVDTYLVLVRGAHILYDIVCLGYRDAALLRDDLSENSVDLTGHVGCVTANIQVRLFEEKLVDFLSPFF